MVSRRRTLHLLGAGLFGLGGCSERGENATPTRTPSPTGTATGTPTAATDTTSTGTPSPSGGGFEIDGATPDWERSIGERVHGDPVYADGHVVLAAGETVYGLDAETGETAWTFDPPVSIERRVERFDATFRVHDGTLYALVGVHFGLGGRDYRLSALRPDGTERWYHESELGGFHEFVGFRDGVVVLVTNDDEFQPDGQSVVAVDRGNGRERWRADTGDAFGGAVGSEVATVNAGDRVVDCFDLATGDRRFRFSPPGDDPSVASAVGDGPVFVALRRYDADGDDPTLYALSPVSGDEIWSLAVGSVTSLRLLDDLYVGGASVRRVGSDGSEVWRYDDGESVTGVPFDEGALYIDAESQVVKIDRGNGRELWTANATVASSPVAVGGDAVLSVGDSAVTARSVGDGVERWRAISDGEHLLDPMADATGAYLVTGHGGVVKVPF
ncbi:PQQ-binding-like beta-propeller repeat protein [Halorarum halophilum]|uniref:PQQ-binding-like beta-propeller repeat protein n=1 Tax=Halorarum halophilum TaxID=2743090 RepID=A0A7D5K7L2_9EURY|nr:PQQ-binding-like beta-propeller repeat protein [Halobaculum halophilum]QLG27474.1 PQQ-binding-like beta-propeller repeat protein [Halobaculum halophilum]